MAKKADAREAGRPVTVFPHPSGVLLNKGLEALGFPFEEALLPNSDATARISGITVRGSASMIPLIERYLKELELFNAVFDLVGAETGTEQGRSDLIVCHILDSLAPWKAVSSALFDTIRSRPLCNAGDDAPYTIADAGSGAGFPGIPLAIAFPSVRFVLVERMAKRCAFLENCTAILGLSNVSVCNSEVEKAPDALCDLAVFRAFRPLDRTMIRTLYRMVVPGGFLAAWKARKDKIEEEMRAVEKETSGWKVIPLKVPFLEHEERRLVLTSSAESPNPLRQGSC